VVKEKELKLKSQQQQKHTKKCLVINKNKIMKYIKLFENFDELFEDYSLYLESDDFELEDDSDYGVENFTYADMEDVKELYEEGLDAEQIAIEMDLPVSKVNQIIRSLRKSGDINESKKSGVTASLKKKSKASGIPVSILRKVFSKGMQAWNAGHRPGVAQHQWGMGRVNSFITGAGGARKADADLWAKAKAAKARKKKKK